MKKKCLLLIIISNIFLFNVIIINASTDNKNVVGKIIYIDPGHGGIDPGTTYKEIRESDITLSISTKIKQILENKGITVYMTRYDDYDLSTTTSNLKRSDIDNRVNLINESSANMFISIHVNSESTQKWYGIQTFYSVKNNENSHIAKILQSNLLSLTSKKRKEQEVDNIYLLNNIKIPGALIEVGFLSNSIDRVNLIDDVYQNEIALNITQTIIDYLG